MRTDDNLEDREDKFANQFDSKCMYMIPLTYLCNLGKINFPTKIDLKIWCTLQTNMKQLFESRKKVTAIGTPDAQIVFVRAPYLQYEQILLTNNTVAWNNHALIKGFEDGDIQRTPYQKTYELQAGSQGFIVDFKGCDR